MLHNLEALREAQIRAMESARLENEFAATLPLPPRSMTLKGYLDIPRVSYAVDTLAHAVALFQKFTPAPFSVARGTFCSLAPKEALLARKDGHYTTFTDVDGAPYFEVSAGEGYSVRDMVFYATRAGGDVFKVDVSIATPTPFGVCLVLVDPYARRGGRRYDKSYRPPHHSDTIKWSYGEDSVRATFWFRDLASFWLSMEEYLDLATTD